MLRCNGERDNAKKEKNDNDAYYFLFSHGNSIQSYVFKCDIILKTYSLSE
jgi:hypothetical protein